MDNEKYVFSKNIHHVLIDNEFILFEDNEGLYILLDEKRSRDLLDIFSNKISKNNSTTLNYLINNGIVTIFIHEQRLNHYRSEDLGVDNYEWRLNKNYQKQKINALQYISALFMLIKVKMCLSFFGLGFMLKSLAQRKSRNKIPSARTKINDSAAINYALRKVAPFMPFKTECLEHSLALFQLLISREQTTTFNIGVQNYSFLAHAWVEIDDVIIGDNLELKQKLAIIYRL